MLKRIYHSQSKTVAFGAVIIAFFGVVSRLFGLLRDRMLAGRFGAGMELDAYFAAFRIPDFVYGILIAGGIGVAFLPVFSEYFGRENQWSKKTLEFTNNVLNCFFVVLVLLCAILAVFAPFIINLIIPGFPEEAKKITIALTRLMLLSPVLFGISGIFSGVLHYFNKFFAYSLAPVLYNLGIIFGIIFFVPLFGVFGLAYGVILGAFLHLIIQIPAAKLSGFQYRPVLDFNFPGLKKIFILMVPRIVGVAISHINLIIVTAIASTLVVGSVTIFNFSNNLHYLPIGVIGFSFAISSFPLFSRYWANGQKKEFFENLSLSVRQIILFIIPASVLMFLLRAQIVRLVLGTGEFGWVETRLTAASLGIFCIAIFASGLIPLLTKAFFAIKNTKIPALIGVVSVGLNIFFCFLFLHLLKQGAFRSFFSGLLKLESINNIEVIGFPLALSLSALVQFILLFVFLYKKIGDFGVKEIAVSFFKILIASGLMGYIAYGALKFASSFVDMQTFVGVMIQTITALAAGGSFYLVFLIILKVSELGIIKKSIFGK